MALSTYAELQTSITNTLDRSDLSTAAVDFIRMAEATMQRDLTHWRMEETDYSYEIDGRFESLPDNFLAFRRIRLNGTEGPLRLITLDEMQSRRDGRGDSTGVPLYCALIDELMEFLPTPGQSYTAEFTYRRTIPALSDSNTTNWLLDLAPDLYLYASLLHSAPYLVEDERLAVWGQLYQQGVDRLNAESERGQWGGQLRRTVMR